MTRMDRAGSGGRAPQGWTKLSGIGHSNERRTPVNGNRAHDRDEEQQQCECRRNRRQIAAEIKLFDEEVPRSAHVGIEEGSVETSPFRMVEVIDPGVTHVDTRHRLVTVRTVMHVYGPDPHDHQGYADEPNQQLGVRSGHPGIVGGTG